LTINKAVSIQYQIVMILIEQYLTSPPTQYRLSGRQFDRSKDPTNSIKVLKEQRSWQTDRRTDRPLSTANHRAGKSQWNDVSSTGTPWSHTTDTIR